MSESILNSVKKVLGLEPDYTPFDLDVLMHINTAFSTLHQLGIGPSDGFMIEDDTTTWDAFLGGVLPLNSVKTLIFMKVRMIFDPPGTAALVSAYERQIQELEWRLSVYRENKIAPFTGEENPIEVVVDGGGA